MQAAFLPMKIVPLICTILFFASAGIAADFETFLEPSLVIDLSMPYRDKLDTILVKNGDSVHTGQVLAEIGAGVLKAQLERARKSAALHSDIDAAEALVTMRSNRLAMLKKLEQSGNTRPQEIIAAKTDLAMAQAQLLGAGETQELRALDIKVIEAQLKEKILTSPIDGIVRKVYKQEGELIGGLENEPLMTLIRLDPLLAVFYLPPKAGMSLKKGEKVDLLSGDQRIQAEVSHVSPVIDPQSGTVEIRLEIANPENHLIAGNRCRLSLAGKPDYE